MLQPQISIKNLCIPQELLTRLVEEAFPMPGESDEEFFVRQEAMRAARAADNAVG